MSTASKTLVGGKEMIGNRRNAKRLCVCALLVSVLVTSLLGVNASAIGSYYGGSDSLYRTSLDDVESYLTATTYDEYKYVYGNVPMGEEEVVIDITDYVLKPEGEISKDDKTPYSSGAIKVLENGIGGYNGKVVICGDDSVISWKFSPEKDVRYNIRIEYYTGDFNEGDHLIAKSAAAERYVLIDGTVPYKEARSVEFEKIWADVYNVFDENGKVVYNADGSKKTYLSTDEKFLEFVRDQANMSVDSDRIFLKDFNGNELKPDKKLIETWVETDVYDSTGYFSEPLSFYFSGGKDHYISLQAVREPLAIKSIKLVAVDETDTYEEYLNKHSGVSDYTGSESFKVQAEYPVITSGNTIYSLNDRSSSYSEPQDSALIRLNEIGGDKWQYVGQWIEWEIVVPEEGFYSIIPRSQQNYYSGIYVSRKIYINGELPFKEAGNLRFPYSSDWQTKPLNDGGDPFKFYLKEGVNKIRFEVVLGDMSEILRTVENSLSSINGYYRKILMITGPEADEYRDYGFDKLIPDVLKGLGDQSKELYRVSDLLTELTGEKGEHSSTLDRVALTCERMSKYPGTIAAQMKTLKDYTASLGTWLSNTQNQPLDIDYISVQAVQAESPEAEPGFFGSLWYEVKKFYMSFFSDYNSLGSTGEEAGASDVKVEVWTATSRDQAQILRSLVDDNFTPNYEGIAVDIKLVAGGTLLPATLAGTGPDVYLGAGQGDPVNYAIRSAVLSLNSKSGDTTIGYNFTDLKNSVWNSKEDSGEYKYPAFHKLIEGGVIKSFEEVTEWFADQALVPLTLYGETYALPMTMSFSMMFYRKDIFVELGIEVPNTWDDFYDIIYSLQSNSLDIGFPQGTGGSMVLMYQQNEPLYDMGNYEYYTELFRRYYYDGDYDNISDADLKALDEKIASEGLTYINDEGKSIPKTDGMTINLDSDISLAAFRDVCRLFTMYDFPISYDFANRFRSGEMPLAISDYSSYNTLIVFAPEINGLWEFTPLPGTANELTQEINNVTIGGISTVMLMNSVSDEEDVALGSWAFMQWYLSADIQSAYGNEMVALLGPSAKQPTSNINALANMAWSSEEYNNLFSQFNAVACTPEFPGSYIIGRYTNFAFLDVVNSNAEPVEELQSYIPDINVELTRKREEFGLPTYASIREMLEQVREKYPDWDKGGNK